MRRSSTGPGISEHDQIVIGDTDLKATINVKKPRNIQMFNKAEWDNIRNDITQLEESFISENPSQRSVDENWTIFKDSVLQTIDRWVPTKISKTKNELPWVTREITHLKRQKQRAHTKARHSKSDRDWARFRHIRKNLRQVMRKEYMDYINNLIDPAKDPSNKNLWRYLKSQKQDHVGVAPLKAPGKLITNAAEKAEILNQQFASVFTEERLEDMPDKGPSPHPISPEITITRNGVEKLLLKVKPKKASGPDQIPARFLKEMAAPLSALLAFIFQQSLDTGTVPSDWRKANVVPIFKKGDRGTPANYRLVSLTALVCKVMEHIVVSNIMDHLDAYHILCDNQHGFRAKRSCETQLLITTQDIASALNNKRQIDLAVLDFSKAFDKVPHQRLVQKLQFYGITGPTVRWIESFLSGRSQKVVVDGAQSLECPVISGVPQGTVLGPLLFLLFINDIAENIKSPIRLFADDCGRLPNPTGRPQYFARVERTVADGF